MKESIFKEQPENDGRKMLAAVLLLMLAVVSLTPRLAAQRKPVDAASSNQSPIRVQVDLVNLHAAVFDKNGRVVTGLKESNFTVYEDNVRQTIAIFGAESETPVTVGILVDTSGSMGQVKIDKAVDAVKVLANTLSPNDEIFVMGFTNQPYMVQGFTPAHTDLSRPLSRLFSKGATSVGAGVEEGL